MPKILKEDLKVFTDDYDVDGKKIEPEQKKVERILTVDPIVQLSIAGEIKTEQPYKTEVIYEGTAAQFGMNMRTCCQLCKHFNRASWKNFLKQVKAKPDPRHLTMLNDIRAAFLEHQGANVSRDVALGSTPELEKMLRELPGMCEAQTDIFKDEVYVFPNGGCPTDTFGPNGEDLSNLFQYRDQDAEKEGAQLYDSVLQVADKK